MGRRTRRERSYRNWWARRWSEILESFQIGGRLGRGRNYQRQGQVIELEFEKGSATAMVQGSRDAPYLVRMHFAMLSGTDWKRALRALGEDAELGGGLFRGDFPQRVEEAFTSQDLSLFPTGQGDLKAACSCPDKANPCKHVAAVYYALGEEIDRDPFLIFRLRGLDRMELMEALARTPAARAALMAPPTTATEARDGEDPREDEVSHPAQSQARSDDTPPEEQPLSEEPHLFWAGLEAGNDTVEDEEVRIPQVSGALARRLGGFPFWRGENSCSLAMDQIYRASSQTGLSIYLGEADSEKSEDS